jgi:hypothetical protein
MRDDGLLAAYFVFPSLTQKAADKNRRSQNPPAVWICARTYGIWYKVDNGQLNLGTGITPLIYEIKKGLTLCE